MRRVLARHHVIEFEDCDARRSDDPARIGAALRRLCGEAALHVVRSAKHEFTPHGLTVLFVLRESHLAYSSWPERRYAVLDLFLCAATPGLAKATARLARSLGAKRIRARHFSCGPVS